MSFPLLSDVFEAFERRILGSELQQHFQANGVTVFKESTKDRACLFILERGLNPQLFLLSRQGPTFEIAVLFWSIRYAASCILLAVDMGLRRGRFACS